MGIRLIGTEDGLSGKALAGDLVAHLVILMDPHIVADGSRQGIECQYLQPLHPLFVAGVRIEMFIRIHLLYDSA